MSFVSIDKSGLGGYTVKNDLHRSQQDEEITDYKNTATAPGCL